MTKADAKQGGTAVKLANGALNGLPSRVAVPRYDRNRITAGIVHIGVGGFHRAHQAVYVDDLLALPGAETWGICGVGLLPHDRRMAEALIPQDCLYTVVERGAGGDTSARVVGAITEFMLAPDDPEAVIERMSSEDIRIVSLTITEGGYCFNQATGELMVGHPDIAHDLNEPHRPVGAFGYLAEALDRRRTRGLKPFTVMSCDNVQGNGDVCRRMVLAFAGLRDPALRDWIERNVTFPNTMVDRITPTTGDEDRAFVRTTFGIDDAWPVMTEPFRQWVIEDRFCNGRPPWERAGVQITTDVHPYEMMKIRLLNASHSAMGYLGYLAGYEYVFEIMAEDPFRRFIAGLMDEEVTPILDPVEGIDLADYKRALIERFSNPNIKDKTARICMDGSAKIPKFVLPTVREQLARGGPTRRLALVVASWCRYLTGTDERGAAIAIEDPMADTLSARARTAGRDASVFLSLDEIFGDLSQFPHFVDQVEEALGHLYDQGAMATLRTYL
jgi:mannitol 2-dehydrogenase